jgi:hypothetical protein
MDMYISKKGPVNQLESFEKSLFLVEILFITMSQFDWPIIRKKKTSSPK